MKKVILGLAAIVGVGIVGLLGAASMQADKTHLDRSIVVEASPADMKYFSHDLEGVNAWSPWEGKDPEQSREYSDPSSGVGAVYHWKGNSEVGEGTMTIRSAREGEVVIDLHFIEPFEADSLATITYVAEGEGTKVTWAFDQDNTFMSKLAMVFMDMEAMMGPDFEKGLALLKPLVEAKAKERVAKEKAEADAKAAAEAEAKAKADADAAAAADPNALPSDDGAAAPGPQ